MSILFDQRYFERGIELGISGYTNYRWIPELTIPMAHWLIKYLNIQPRDTVLDFGCAKGYLVLAFRLLHYQMFGYDISKYAIENAPTQVKQYIYNDMEDLAHHYTWIIAKDVFEHIPYEDIYDLLKILRTMCSNLFCIVPLGQYDKYNVPSYENDVTHIIREPLEWWNRLFEEVGFEVKESVYRKKHIKENYTHYEKGNGFFTLAGDVG